MSELLKGAPAASALDEKTIEKVNELKARGIQPCLAMLRVGEDEGALSYERGAIKRCDKVGIAVKEVVLPADVTQEKLMETIDALKNDADVHGVLMFRPLPKTLDEKTACEALAPKKDVDGITTGSMAKIYSGAGEGFAPCTATSVMEMLKYYNVELSGKRAVVVGRSLVIGRPVAMLLMQANATVTVCHTKTRNMAEIVREADVLVVAAGKGESIGKEYFRPGQVVVDVGINWSESRQKLVGDVKFDEAEPIVSAISPVPGGVGSMTTAILASHVVEAAERN